MIHEPRGAGSGQSTHPLSPSEKIAHGGNRTRGSLPLAPWPEERQPTELPPPPPPPRTTISNFQVATASHGGSGWPGPRGNRAGVAIQGCPVKPRLAVGYGIMMNIFF